MSTVTGYTGYVDPEYLRTVGALLNKQKQLTYTHMQIHKGHRVLDVGCGPGTDTIQLAPLVGTKGEVIGVDQDQSMIDEAERRSHSAGVGEWVHHRVADAAALPFEDGYFDSCRSERLFQHLLNPKAVLAEMARVTKHNGWVVVLDTDWGSFSIDSSEVDADATQACVAIDIERRFMRFFAEKWQHNGYAGRQLYRLFKQQALVDISFEAFAVPITSYALVRQIMSMDRAEQHAIAENVISAEELRRWQEALERADAEGVFFGYGCLIMVSGRKG
jgi:ubiquinone/menaquinone biosynthesis C-methylase UbiE